MKAIIVDDDDFYCNLLQDFCKKTNIEVVQTFNQPLKALEFLKKQVADIVFLDIHMPDLNGFELLETLPQTQVIITTQDETKAVKAFDYNVIDFLLKPIEFSRFLKAIQKAEDNNNNNGGSLEKEIKHIYVNINKRLIKVNIEDINFVEAKGNYVLIDLSPKENLIVHNTLKKIKEKLPSENFTQVHRSFIININKIVDIEDSTIVINRKVIPLITTYRAELMNKLNLLK